MRFAATAHFSKRKVWQKFVGDTKFDQVAAADDFAIFTEDFIKWGNLDYDLEAKLIVKQNRITKTSKALFE